jgi:flagellar hook-basal body complex protein FliE
MSNLTIENINKIVQSGETEKLFESTMNRDGLKSTSTQEASKTFSQILEDSLDKVNLYQSQADTAIKELVAGRTKNIHETMLTIERADTSLKMMMQVRNKILDAYREIMRMQV